MDDVFYIDVKDGVNISYHQLIEDVRNTSVYNPYCKEESYYEVFKNIVTSLVIGEEIILLDADFTDVEVRKLVGDVDFENVSKKASYITPVPGGVGPMTIAMLMHNVVKAAKNTLKSK